MGKIAIPIQDNIQSPEPKTDLGLRATDMELIEELSDGLTTDELIEFTEDELKYTNEVIRLIPIRKALGVEGTDTEHDAKIKEIMSWAKEKGIHNKNHLLSELRQIDFKLGNPDGKSKVDKVYEYIRIEGQIRGLVNKQVALENAG